MWGLWEIASQMTPHPRPEAIALSVEVVAARGGGEAVGHRGAGGRRAARDAALQPRPERPVGHDQHPDRRGAGAASRRDRAQRTATRPPRSASSSKATAPTPRSRARRSSCTGRPRPHAELAMARPRQRDRRDRGVDGRPRRAADQGARTRSSSRCSKELRAQATKPVNGSKALYGHGHLAPTWTKERPRFSPLMLYSWDQTAGGAARSARPRRLALRGHRARVHATRRPAAR